MQEYYAAPMEGLTGWRWRQVQSELFGGADRYALSLAQCQFRVSDQGAAGDRPGA